MLYKHGTYNKFLCKDKCMALYVRDLMSIKLEFHCSFEKIRMDKLMNSPTENSNTTTTVITAHIAETPKFSYSG